MAENILLRCRCDLQLRLVWARAAGSSGRQDALREEVKRVAQRLSSPATHFLLPNGAIHGSQSDAEDDDTRTIREALEAKACGSGCRGGGNKSKTMSKGKGNKGKRGKKGGKKGKRVGGGGGSMRANAAAKSAEDYLTALSSGMQPVLELTVVSSLAHSLPQVTVAPFIPTAAGVRLDGAACNRDFHGVSLDVLCSAQLSGGLTAAMSNLATALASQLEELAAAAFSSCSSSSFLSSPWAVYHFPPSSTSLAEWVTLRRDQIETEVQRAALHKQLNLPADRPLLKPSAALGYDPDADAREPRDGIVLAGPGWPLHNVHHGVPGPTGIPAPCHVVLVQGAYAYYHYLQGGERDKGWGCAYRSLQTIISWFKLNHFTSCRVPTHRETQQALVDMGEQKPSFVGSNNWIGSIEVGECIGERWLNIASCKRIYLHSGADMPTTARQLAQHFEEEGTPVMIGGGALAFTLLGVAFNAGTGAAKFLILDPHYTGADDLSSVQNRMSQMEGYKAVPCSWRGEEAFNKHSSYNLCLPLRPRNV